LSERSSGKNWTATRIGNDCGVYARQSRVRGAQPRKLSGQFKFTEAISFSVNCETQDEIDYFWEKLSADGGSTWRCGWLKDKFGLSWQVNPVFLGDMLADPDPGKANRVMKAMMEMEKIDIAALEKAAQR
jgi:predicted 3-demethylubiquinone-9 3-methyltransferase (glyoxalase superfamily)